MSCVIEFDNNACIHKGERKRERQKRKNREKAFVERKRKFDWKSILKGFLFTCSVIYSKLFKAFME
jgi:hypothetical protein